jgi:hypothetical protein
MLDTFEDLPTRGCDVMRFRSPLLFIPLLALLAACALLIASAQVSPASIEGPGKPQPPERLQRFLRTATPLVLAASLALLARAMLHMATSLVRLRAALVSFRLAVQDVVRALPYRQGSIATCSGWGGGHARAQYRVDSWCFPRPGRACSHSGLSWPLFGSVSAFVSPRSVALALLAMTGFAILQLVPRA